MLLKDQDKKRDLRMKRHKRTCGRIICISIGKMNLYLHVGNLEQCAHSDLGPGVQ